MQPNITIVTAFFDLGRGDWQGYISGHPLPHYLKRSTEHYFSCFERLLKLDNDIVVVTSSDLIEKFKPYLEKKPNLTILDFEDWRKDLHPDIRKKVEAVHKDLSFMKMVQQPYNPEYWSADYIMVNFLKSYFVNYAMEMGIVKTELVSWIDFGYCREDSTVPTNTWSYDFNPELIHFFSVKNNVPTRIDLKDIIATNNVFIQGCHIVASKKNWYKLLTEVHFYMNQLLSLDLVDDDQTILLMAYVMHPEWYEIHYLDESKGWFQIFKEFSND